MPKSILGSVYVAVWMGFSSELESASAIALFIVLELLYVGIYIVCIYRIV